MSNIVAFITNHNIAKFSGVPRNVTPPAINGFDVVGSRDVYRLSISIFYPRDILLNEFMVV